MMKSSLYFDPRSKGSDCPVKSVILGDKKEDNNWMDWPGWSHLLRACEDGLERDKKTDQAFKKIKNVTSKFVRRDNTSVATVTTRQEAGGGKSEYDSEEAQRQAQSTDKRNSDLEQQGDSVRGQSHQ
ncbi:MAG: hypothetical protein NXY57DRAFT_1042722 [Lentinula lateritia]|nr:MAG: hypothetical protein NXY57DRAFT_1042722 [Lentinula lateritia]